MTIEWVLGVVAALFGGLNIFQIIFWKTERQKHQAEASSAEADARQKSIDLQQDHYDFLQAKLGEWEKQYYDVVAKLQETMQEKAQMATQISELKAEVEKQNRQISELKKEIETLSSKFAKAPSKKAPVKKAPAEKTASK